MSNTEEYCGSMDEVIERFKEVIATAKPGQFVEFSFLVPKPKKEIVKINTISGKVAKDFARLVNNALIESSITNPGYIAMDCNGTWFYYPNIPEADIEEGSFMSEGEATELFYVDPSEINLDWTKTIRYVY